MYYHYKSVYSELIFKLKSDIEYLSGVFDGVIIKVIKDDHTRDGYYRSHMSKGSVLLFSATNASKLELKDPSDIMKDML